MYDSARSCGSEAQTERFLWLDNYSTNGTTTSLAKGNLLDFHHLEPGIIASSHIPSTPGVDLEVYKNARPS